MTLRCGCENEADDIVFGPSHRCAADPKTPADLPRFVPSWAFVVPAPLREVSELRQSDFTLSPPAEQPWETTLSDGDGDLG